jgi:rubrerythrin
MEKRTDMNTIIKEYLSKMGRRGGKSGVGEVKARTSDQARSAVNARWQKWGCVECGTVGAGKCPKCGKKRVKLG